MSKPNRIKFQHGNETCELWTRYNGGLFEAPTTAEHLVSVLAALPADERAAVEKPHGIDLTTYLTAEAEREDGACHKCGKQANVNDGDDGMGPPVCVDCYDAEWSPPPEPAPAGVAPCPHLSDFAGKLLSCTKAFGHDGPHLVRWTPDPAPQPAAAPKVLPVEALQRWRSFLEADTADDDTREQAYRYIAAAHDLIGGIDSRHTKDHGLNVYDCAIAIAKSVGLTDYVERGGEGKGDATSSTTTKTPPAQ